MPTKKIAFFEDQYVLPRHRYHFVGSIESVNDHPPLRGAIGVATGARLVDGPFFF
jgi:hypothetical protein